MAVGCGTSGCAYSAVATCAPDVCSDNMLIDYYCSPGSGSCQTKNLGCHDSCCPSGQTCQGSPATCQIVKKCFDNDRDGHEGKTSDCNAGTDCNDANPSVWKLNACGVCASEPSGLGGSCSVGVGACKKAGSYVCDSAGTGSKCSTTAWSPTTEICGNGVDEDCDGTDKVCPPVPVKTCGDGVVQDYYGEVCDPASFSAGFKSVECGGGYPSVSVKCKSDCSGYETANCGFCGDGKC